MIALIHHAVHSGITFLDTNELLLGKALKGIRHKVQLATKFGGTYGVNGDPAYVLNVDYNVPIVEKDIIPTCRELGIGIVVYSPLGRGLFSAGAKILENATETDFRKIAQPRMQGEKKKRAFGRMTPLQVAGKEAEYRRGHLPGMPEVAPSGWRAWQPGGGVAGQRHKSFEEPRGGRAVDQARAKDTKEGGTTEGASERLRLLVAGGGDSVSKGKPPKGRLPYWGGVEVQRVLQ
ncbi:hypothetical protein GOP47_0027484 [Adiantum capillus-veneris]|nr:hypothetical protein GOP47_0027484 [Adiantum capillus-veneris]